MCPYRPARNRTEAHSLRNQPADPLPAVLFEVFEEAKASTGNGGWNGSEAPYGGAGPFGGAGAGEGEDYISPAWAVVSNRVLNTNDANLVMSKAWLIGFTEAEGSFYLVNKSKDRIVHGFEITKILDLIEIGRAHV